MDDCQIIQIFKFLYPRGVDILIAKQLIQRACPKNKASLNSYLQHCWMCRHMHPTGMT